MNAAAVSVALRRTRAAAGLTQAELARRMGTTQSVVSRAERDWTRMPSLEFVDRYARGCGKPITLTLGRPQAVSRDELRRRLNRLPPAPPFNPYDRNPSVWEVRSLLRDGLRREHFESV